MNHPQPIPRFPITPHLLGSKLIDPNGDVQITATQMDVFTRKGTRLLLEEKLDGANVGILFDPKRDTLAVRNRDHHLQKGYQKKETPSKLQFRALWGWIYDHKREFQNLIDLLDGIVPCVYGEWLYARHTLHYDRLPALFIPFGLRDLGSKHDLDPLVVRNLMDSAGFCNPPRLNSEFGVGLGDIPRMAEQPSEWSSTAIREGVYLKAGDGYVLTGFAKYVRSTFLPREDFTTSPLEKNSLA